MNLFDAVVTALETKDRSLSWLANELDRTLEGLKLSLKNETIKYSDLKKLISVLNMPIQAFFEGSIHQSIKGDYNVQANHSMVSEPNGEYYKINYEKQIAQLESQLQDKDHIIELLKQQIK